MEFTMDVSKARILFLVEKESYYNMISKDCTFAVPSILGHKAYCSLNPKDDPRAKNSGK